MESINNIVDSLKELMKMKKYRMKDPVIVEAVQFDPNNVWPDCVHPHRKEGIVPRDMSWGYVETVKGIVHILTDDWIIKGVAGFFVCKPDVFERTYEVVGDKDLLLADFADYEKYVDNET